MLCRPTRFEMIIPDSARDGKKPRTLILLHGYTGASGNWVPEYLTEKYNFAVVSPEGENSFWLDGRSTGHRFCSFLGIELIDYLRRTFGLASSPEETYIMGFSMGGFGSLHTAFAFPEVFGKTAALSSALIVHEVAGMKEGTGNDVANYDYYRECFIDPANVLESDANPETLVRRLKENGKKIPEIFMSCGTEDFLLENNREFHRFLESIGVEHTYMESAGAHNMEFWTEYAVKFSDMMFGKDDK